MVLLLLIYVLTIVCGGSALVFVFLYALLYDLSSVAIILMRTSELVVMLLLSLGLHFVIVVFPDRTYLLTF